MAKKIIKSKDLSDQASLAARLARSPAEKKAQTIQDLSGVVTKKSLEAQVEAHAMLEAAQFQADQIVAEAQAALAEVDAIRTQAHEEGLEQGREEGLASVTEQLVALAAQKEAFFTNAEPQVLQLVMHIAEKVLGKLATESGAMITAVVRQAIEASIGDRITVHVHPDDLVWLKTDEHAFANLVDRAQRLHFKEDDTVTRGGCVVETEVGTIDARLETQLRAIQKALEL